MSLFDVTITGEVNLDLILYGLPETMALDRELLAKDFRLTLGSSSAILAHNLAALGSRVGFITQTGADGLGQIAMDRLREAGVDLSQSSTSYTSLQTGVTILLTHGQTRHILTYPGVMSEMSVADLNFEYLANGRHYHLSSLYLQTGLQPGIVGLCRRLKERGLTISLDTNDDPSGEWGAPLDELLGLVDLFMPNEDEAMRMTWTKTADEAADRLTQKVPLVAIKCGRRGCLVQDREQRWYVPAEIVEPVDTIGAGDSFNAGFLSGYLKGRTPEECGRMGNASAAFSTQSAGGTESFRDKARLKKFLQNRWWIG